MRNRFSITAALAASLLASGWALAQPADSTGPASAALEEFFAQEWERGLQEDPENATAQGDTRFNDRWTDRSIGALLARQKADREALQRLHAIDRSALPSEQALNYDIYDWLLQRAVERQRFRDYLEPVDQYNGAQTADGIVEVTPFRDAKDYRAYLRRLQGLPARVEQEIALMQEGLAAGITPPRVVIERVPAQISRQIVDDPAASAFYRPFLGTDAPVPAPEWAQLQAQARALIGTGVVPAFRRLQDFIAKQYLPRCRTTIAASALPDGRAYYEFLVRQQTTTDRSVEEIHQTGLQEVARLRAKLEAAKGELGFKGALRDFYAYLRSDPKFFYRSPEELLQGYRALAKRVDPELIRISRLIPRLPYGVREIPAVAAPDAPTAYYQPGAADGSRAGYYFVNLYQPGARPKWEMVPLTLHEAVPGHHFQFARSLELPQQPMFRKTAYFVAYSEGWALYAEQLGYDMGLYADPYDRIGQLTYEMWRAVRLVVDTGIHAMGWSREQAISYFRENTAKADLDIANEVDRYISMPAQALTYKIGELTISGLRRRAQAELGEGFDLRDFDDAVLETGSVPLVALQEHMDRWIGAQRDRLQAARKR